MKKFWKTASLVIDFFRGRKRFNDLLPFIFNDIDKYLPGMIGHATGYEVKELIARAIEGVTGKKATKRQINKVIELYSPIVGAIKAFQK